VLKSTIPVVCLNSNRNQEVFVFEAKQLNLLLTLLNCQLNYVQLFGQPLTEKEIEE
jgi:hypothetical protein